MNISERIQLVVSYFITFSLVLALGGAAWAGQWFNFFLALLTLILTFVPSVLKRNYRIHLPIELELIFVFFVYSALYLGEVRLYYVHYWWWDIFLHTFSGLLLGLVGFLIVYILNSEEKFEIQLSPRFVALFTFIFSMAIGAVWEIFEFSMDTFFGLNMQKSGLVDTMTDLIVNMTGALVVSTMGYFYMRRSRVAFFDGLIQKFMKRNPRLFRRFH